MLLLKFLQVSEESMMKNFAYLLIIISFLIGSFLTSLDPEKVNWLYFIPTIILGFVGLGIIKSGDKKEAQSASRLEDDLALMTKSIDQIVSNLKQLNEQKESLPTYEVRFEIDKRFRKDLNNFAEVRSSMRHLFGLQKYADIMSTFAAGERYINRIWSASTDGYVEEVKTYLAKSFTQFTETQTSLAKATAEIG